MKTIQEQLTEALANIATITANSEASATAVQSLTRENAGLKVQVEAANKLASEGAAAVSELKTVKEQNTTLTGQVTALTTERDTLKSEVDKIPTTVAAQLAERAAAQGIKIEAAGVKEVKQDVPGGVQPKAKNELKGRERFQAAARENLVSMGYKPEQLSKEVPAGATV